MDLAACCRYSSIAVSVKQVRNAGIIILRATVFADRRVVRVFALKNVVEYLVSIGRTKAVVMPEQAAARLSTLLQVHT